MVSRVALLLCCAAAPAFGQDTATVAATDHFRRGQWVAHFDLGSFTTVGAARFRSPTRATVFQLDVLARHAESATDTTWDGTSSIANVTARIGWRRYRTGIGRVTPYYTFGPLVTFSHSYYATPAGGYDRNGFGLGLFADLGASYHVAEWLALGAAGNVDLRYTRSWSRESTGLESTQWDVALTGVTIRAGLTLKF